MWRERNISSKIGLIGADLLQTVNKSVVIAARTTRFPSATETGADFCNSLLTAHLHLSFRKVRGTRPGRVPALQCGDGV
jgi:hypothetical protein